MNLVLFEAAETTRPLPRADRRARHILEVLRRAPGDTFDAGLIDGPRGKATVASIAEHEIGLAFAWGAPPPPRPRLALIVGLPRPQTARDVLRDATTLGATELHFVRTEKSDAGYAQSTLWSSGEWRRHVIAGAEQAFDPALPAVTFSRSLAAAISALPASDSRIALDNYESATLLSAQPDFASGITLAVGAERGWSAAERDALRAHGFALAHLGARVLRTETACLAALSIIRARLGLM